MNKVFSVIEKICIAAEFILLAWVFMSFIDVWCHDLARDLDLWLGNANFVNIICNISIKEI